MYTDSGLLSFYIFQGQQTFTLASHNNIMMAYQNFLSAQSDIPCVLRLLLCRFTTTRL